MNTLFDGQSLEQVLAERQQTLRDILSRTPDRRKRQEIRARWRAGDERIRKIFSDPTSFGDMPLRVSMRRPVRERMR